MLHRCPAVSHIKNFLATGHPHSAEPQDRQTTPRTYAVDFLQAIITQASHILCFGTLTNVPKQRVCWYMMCAAHFCTIIWIRVDSNLCILFLFCATLKDMRPLSLLFWMAATHARGKTFLPKILDFPFSIMTIYIDRFYITKAWFIIRPWIYCWFLATLLLTLFPMYRKDVTSFIYYISCDWSIGISFI